jgi:hypothetical protein
MLRIILAEISAIAAPWSAAADCGGSVAVPPITEQQTAAQGIAANKK